MKAIINLGRTKTRTAAVFAMLKAAGVKEFNNQFDAYEKVVTDSLLKNEDLFLLVDNNVISGRGVLRYYAGYAGFVLIDTLEKLEKALAEPPIFIGEYLVEFLPNGDVKVGCTTVPSATMEKIIKGRQDALVQA